MSRAGESLLERHGTRLHVIKPRSIVEAARADMRRLDQKRAGACLPEAPYAFHRDHVRAAIGIADLLARAIADLGRGQISGKRTTRLIYGDAQLLAAAQAVLGARAARRKAKR